MRSMLMLFMWLGAPALTACATTASPPSLEIPIAPTLIQACETLSIPAESELPALASDAQLAERRYWMVRDLAHEGVERRLCRQRDEAVAVIAQHNQLIRRPEP